MVSNLSASEIYMYTLRVDSKPREAEVKNEIELIRIRSVDLVLRMSHGEVTNEATGLRQT